MTTNRSFLFVSQMKDFISSTKKLFTLTNLSDKIKADCWTVAVRGCWALMIAVGDNPAASSQLVECLQILSTTFLQAISKYQSSVSISRHAHNALIEYVSGLAQFLNQCELFLLFDLITFKYMRLSGRCVQTWIPLQLELYVINCNFL